MSAKCSRYAELLARKRCFGLVGCTNSGKSTLAEQLANELGSEGVKIVKQDDFYKAMDKVEQVKSRLNPAITFYNYDSEQSLDAEKMAAEVRKLCDDPTVRFVIVEGTMLTLFPNLFEPLIDHAIFLTLNENRCRELRETRTYIPPDEPGQFDEIVWPEYQRVLTQARNELDQRLESNKLAFMDASREFLCVKELLLQLRHMANDVVKLISDLPLVSLDNLSTALGSPACGAQSLFLGTTRDSFDGREVIRLEYEAYEAMAYAELRKLCVDVRRRWPEIRRVAIFHRIGAFTKYKEHFSVVPVGECSVAIGTSSPHRLDAIRGTEWLIDELKRRVPIWKRELYAPDVDDELKNNEKHQRNDAISSQWKQNSESIHFDQQKK